MDGRGRPGGDEAGRADDLRGARPGAAMAVVNPIPGQESRNSDYLLENGAAVKINNLATLARETDRPAGRPRPAGPAKQNARRLGRPQAAFEVARAALEWGSRG